MAENSKPDINSLLFAQLVIGFQAEVWQHLGKVANILTGRIEKNLELAKNAIDTLSMLEVKTQGNLSENELIFLRQILSRLRLDYAEAEKNSD